MQSNENDEAWSIASIEEQCIEDIERQPNYEAQYLSERDASIRNTFHHFQESATSIAQLYRGTENNHLFFIRFLSNCSVMCARRSSIIYFSGLLMYLRNPSSAYMYIYLRFVIGRNNKIKTRFDVLNLWLWVLELKQLPMVVHWLFRFQYQCYTMINILRLVEQILMPKK